MAIEFQIIGWKATGLRCPDYEVNFLDQQGQPYLVSLVQMPNGAGKTTTLELLRAALSGSAGLWEPRKVLSIRKPGNQTTEGHFQVTAMFNGKRLTITLTLDFQDGQIDYSTTLGSGMKRGFCPPSDLQRFLRPEFVNFFVFDGELADKLLRHDHTNAQMAIEDLFQLKTLGVLTNQLEDYWAYVVASSGAGEERGLSRRRNRVSTLRSRIRELQQQQNDLKSKADSIKMDLLEKKSRFDKALEEREEFRGRLHNAEMAYTKAETHVRDATRNLLERMRNPHALSAIFAQEVITLKANLDRAKLPESAAREFFEDLAEEEVCVCGRQLDEICRHAIRDRAERYLGSDDVQLLNAIKSDVSTQIGADPNVHETDLLKSVNELRQAIETSDQLRTARDSVQAEAVGGNPELEHAREEIEKLDSAYKSHEHQLRKYDDPTDTLGDRDTFGIAVLHRRLDNADKKLAQITQTLELRTKKDVLKLILDSAQSTSRRSISLEICRQANEVITKLMPDNAIRIREIDQCLILDGKDGGSVGETLSVAYAFLSTLFNQTEHKLPFIVDSPAGPIDLRVRREVAALIPQLTSQFIAFTISSEREWSAPQNWYHVI
jgi:DNA sulfur modification protein DndD